MALSFLDATRQLQAKLRALYDASEAAAIARILLEHHTALPYTTLLARDKSMTPAQETTWHDHSLQLLSGKPVQQVTGHAWFCGKEYQVSPQVLIPRPETEELVAMVLEALQHRTAAQARPLKILDIGTGSGCIAIAIKSALPGAAVTAADVSAGALRVAMTNAHAHAADIHFIQADFLSEASWSAFEYYDCIVSNPPYIPQSEAATLHPNVAHHEPATALFVPDADPLTFYRAIADFGKTHLAKQGRIFCELHAPNAAATKALFEDRGYTTSLHKDLQEKERMISGVRDQG